MIFSREAKTRHLIVISIDALRALDFNDFKDMPNFKAMMEEGAYAKEVESVYPSLTYTVHTSIITGAYPDKHGITDNELLQPQKKSMDWYWYKKYVKVPTLYDLARESGMKVGALLWPVTGKAKVNYNMPEIKAREGQNQTWVVMSNGSPLFLAGAELRYGKLRKGTGQPELDNFTTAVAKDLIKRKKPNLLLVHLTDLDMHRHEYGVSSKEAKAALKRQDGRIGEIVQAVKDAGIYNDTTFVVLGDHGFMDVEYKLNINAELKKQGLISVDKHGRVTDWKAFVKSCDGAAYVYIRNPKDEEIRKKVDEILNSLSNSPDSMIEKIYDKNTMKKMHTGDDAEYMLEARKGYYFSFDINDRLITKIIQGKMVNNEMEIAATHGYLPDKPEMLTFFMLSGNGVKKGEVIDRINIVDEGPTMAALLGLKLQNADGRVLSQLIQ